MLRLPAACVRVTTVVVVVVAPAAPVLAGTEATPQPIIDHAPRRVALGSSVTITGHLKNGTPGDEIELQRRHPRRRWKTIAVKAVDAELQVRFGRPYVTTTADYRMVWVDGVSGTSATSNVKTIRVGSRLEFVLRPDDAMRRRAVRVRGTLRPKRAGRRVRIEHRVDGDWKWVGRARVRDGRFETSFSTRRIGRRAVRVRFAGDEFNTADKLRRRLRVYKPALATWYGPGFYGRRTACGRRLTSETLGVAHRRLPCGTKVHILYRGRTITVPVIDRGPYGVADWDLTSAAAERVGLCCRDTIGVFH